MHITVAICTWNRARLLDQTLAEFAHLKVPHGIQWEIVLVDNNCTDDTANVVKRHAQSLPIRFVEETQQGHSHARNRAVKEARGELILWTDDDVRVSSNWVTEYVAAARTYPDAGYFGGRITPWFSNELTPKKCELIRNNLELLAPIFSLKDYGTDVRIFQSNEGPFGANMGFRKELLMKYPFDPKFGRVKFGLIGADEVSVLRAMQNDGISGVWVGTTEVQHYIPADRSTYGHFWRYFGALGRTQVRLEGAEQTATFCGWPRWALIKGYRASLCAWFKRTKGDARWLSDYLLAAKLLGYAREYKESQVAIECR